MADVETTGPVEPQVVFYDPITGVPPEFNSYLPKDSDEYKRWKSSQEAGTPEEGLAALSLEGGGAAAPAEPEQKLPGGKTKKKARPEVVLERNTRNKKKCVTTISGLEGFGVKLPEAAKLFGKKFASGASIVKNAEGKEHIDVQGDFLDQAAALIVKQFKSVEKSAVYAVEAKRKERYFDSDDDEE